MRLAALSPLMFSLVGARGPISLAFGLSCGSGWTGRTNEFRWLTDAGLRVSDGRAAGGVRPTDGKGFAQSGHPPQGSRWTTLVYHTPCRTSHVLSGCYGSCEDEQCHQ